MVGNKETTSVLLDLLYIAPVKKMLYLSLYITYTCMYYIYILKRYLIKTGDFECPK